MADTPTIALIGLGALGAAHLATILDHDPSVDARVIAGGERAERLRRDGMTVNGKHYDLAVVDPADRTLSPADLVIVVTKASGLESALADVAGQVGPATTIISLLNGVTSEGIIRQAFPDAFVPLAFSVGSNAGRDEAGFRYYSLGRVNVGESRNDPPSEAVARLDDLLTRIGLPHEVPLDMEAAQWRKFVLNVGVNQASAVLETTYGPFQAEGAQARAYMVSLMAETVAVGRAHGVDLSDEDVTRCVATVDSLAAVGYTSMSQDARAHRPMEIDLFAGTVVRLGTEHDVPTPVNALTEQILRAKEETWTI
ncbi:MAG: ketopantoate reductase family protein [Propionibacteriaceae bacterium]|jgi:2-dehydropantoate 2-reductase|nr:ketopantoate reductase family protein [Propionibacteriaceae bacterium]